MDDTTSTATRFAEGIDPPAPGTWAIDPGHADVGFVGRRFGLTRVRGRFGGVAGTVTIADDLARSSVAVAIDLTTVDTGSANRDESLRSANFLDVEQHPTATFRSTGIELAGTTATMAGDLVLRGITRPVVLDGGYLGAVRDPWGTERAIFRASATVDRESWGMTWNMVLDTGRLAVSREITIEIEAELVRA
jgi:polyisoprenoid-binding protein YceI